jgi:hypothetical protein
MHLHYFVAKQVQIVGSLSRCTRDEQVPRPGIMLAYHWINSDDSRHCYGLEEAIDFQSPL